VPGLEDEVHKPVAVGVPGPESVFVSFIHRASFLLSHNNLFTPAARIRACF
jgi:hypothetical protein